jgi:hypothetical protein
MSTFLTGAIVPLSILLPLFYGFLRWEQIGQSGKVVIFYLLISAFINLGADLLLFNRAANLPLLHVYTAIEFIVLSSFYKHLLQSRRSTLILTISQVVFLLLCVINAIFFQSPLTFNSYSLSAGALGMMLMAVNYFAKLATASSGQRVSNQPEFWFNTALFLYFSGSSMLYIASNFLLQVSRKEFQLLWNIHAFFVFFMYILFTIGFIKCKK